MSMDRGRRLGRGLYRLGDGRYMVRVSRREGAPVRRIDTTRIFRERPLAEEFLRRWRIAYSFNTAGLASPVLPADAMLKASQTLKAITDAYVAECLKMGRSQAHVRTVERVFRFVFRALPPEQPVPLVREDMLRVAQFARLHTDSRGDQTRKAFVYLRTAHRRAGLAPPDAPAVHVERTGRRVMTAEDRAALMDAMPLGSVERTLAELILRTACRQEEAFRLRVLDVATQAGEINFETRKGTRAKKVATSRVPIPAGLRVALEAYRAPAEATAPYLTLDGVEPLGETSLVKRIVRASVAAGIDPPVTSLGWLRNHSLTLMGELGIRIEAAARIANHASSRTTEAHYDGSIRWGERVAALRRLDRALGSPPPEHRRPAPDQPISPKTPSRHRKYRLITQGDISE